MEHDPEVLKLRWTPYQLDMLLKALTLDGYEVIGPVVVDGVIKLGKISTTEDLPKGFTDDQEAGRYSIKKRNDEAYFGYNLPPESWRRWLNPPRQSAWRATKVDSTWCLDSESFVQPKMAFLGVRACDLAAMKVQERVQATFVSSTGKNQSQGQAIERPFIIGVQCGQSAPVCFCASMNTGPEINDGCDIVATELINNEKKSQFIIQACTAIGKIYAQGIGGECSSTLDLLQCKETVKAARDHQTRAISIDNPIDFFRHRLTSSHWQEVGQRCLGCSCCTLVCPTCFCTTSFDVTDLTATKTEKFIVWDSCFHKDFTFIHGSSKRDSVASRYRQWMSHKLGSWHEQFGSSGCVGCGRCITWCPVGIDITEEVVHLANTEKEDRACT